MLSYEAPVQSLERVMFVYLPSRIKQRLVEPNANFCLRSVSTFIVLLECFYKLSCACEARKVVKEVSGQAKYMYMTHVVNYIITYRKYIITRSIIIFRKDVKDTLFHLKLYDLCDRFPGNS